MLAGWGEMREEKTSSQEGGGPGRGGGSGDGEEGQPRRCWEGKEDRAWLLMESGGGERGYSGFWMVTKCRVGHLPHGDQRREWVWWGANEVSLDTVKSRRLGMSRGTIQ